MTVFPVRAKAFRYPNFFALLLVWTLVGGLAYTRHLLLIDASHVHVLSDLAEWLTSFYPWVLITPLVFYLERQFPLSRSKWLPHLVWLALAGLPVTFLAREITVVLSVAVQITLRTQPAQPISWWSIHRCEFLMQQALYWCSVLGASIIRNMIDLRESERRAAQLALERSELEGSLRRAELETLRMRLNPHFLFNSLQNISTLTRQDPDTAGRMLTRLGDLLRSALRKEAQAETTLALEIELTKSYVAVEQMRFADRLSVLFDVEADVERALVPSFLLQPLVENAIVHGLRGENAGVIWIRGLQRVNQLVITVSDNGTGLPKEQLTQLEMGIGLGSTLERLERMYSSHHTISIRNLPEGGTEICIVLPLRWEKIPLETSVHEFASIAHR